MAGLRTKTHCEGAAHPLNLGYGSHVSMMMFSWLRQCHKFKHPHTGSTILKLRFFLENLKENYKKTWRIVS